MLRFFLLAIAGATGTLLRYLLGGAIYRLFPSAFPYDTLLINLLGCLLIGFLGTLSDERFFLNTEVRTTVFIGFLGAFTTFSSFAYETWNLVKDGEPFLAALNVGASLVICFLGLMMGVFIARFI